MVCGGACTRLGVWPARPRIPASHMVQAGAWPRIQGLPGQLGPGSQLGIPDPANWGCLAPRVAWPRIRAIRARGRLVSARGGEARARAYARRETGRACVRCGVCARGGQGNGACVCVLLCVHGGGGCCLAMTSGRSWNGVMRRNPSASHCVQYTPAQHTRPARAHTRMTPPHPPP